MAAYSNSATLSAFEVIGRLEVVLSEVKAAKAEGDRFRDEQLEELKELKEAMLELKEGTKSREAEDAEGIGSRGQGGLLRVSRRRRYSDTAATMKKTAAAAATEAVLGARGRGKNRAGILPWEEDGYEEARGGAAATAPQWRLCGTRRQSDRLAGTNLPSSSSSSSSSSFLRRGRSKATAASSVERTKDDGEPVSVKDLVSCESSSSLESVNGPLHVCMTCDLNYV